MTTCHVLLRTPDTTEDEDGDPIVCGVFVDPAEAAAYVRGFAKAVPEWRLIPTSDRSWSLGYMRFWTDKTALHNRGDLT